VPLDPNVMGMAVLTGVELFALKFYLDGSSPINHFRHQKARNTGLPNGEDRIPLHSLALTQYRSVTDRQTDLLQYMQHLQSYALARCEMDEMHENGYAR